MAVEQCLANGDIEGARRHVLAYGEDDVPLPPLTEDQQIPLGGFRDHPVYHTHFDPTTFDNVQLQTTRPQEGIPQPGGTILYY